MNYNVISDQCVSHQLAVTLLQHSHLQRLKKLDGWKHVLHLKEMCFKIKLPVRRLSQCGGVSSGCGVARL